MVVEGWVWQTKRKLPGSVVRYLSFLKLSAKQLNLSLICEYIAVALFTII
jgi:hypothetical protein